MLDNEKYKLTTRRMIAWGVGGLAAVTIAFVGIYGTVTRQIDLVNLSIGFLGGILSSVVVFYFAKPSTED